MKRYIPIIGTISAGKSTFLKAFLGINVLQAGSTTTTKFVCLIKHSDNICFYHVIPKVDNGIEFYKDGKELRDEESIQKRIEEINDELNKNKGNKNDIFYMLETPIKNINNAPLLENCYFMDIPGLNENNSTYIEDIFSLITFDDILFEIMVFDSTSIGGDNILNIFQALEKKNCLKKEKNLYILNKIDQTTKGGEGDIIDSFKNYFYTEFEDEKKKDKSRIIINFSDNYFIPMNSLLYQAETKINDDFYSLLLFELFTFLEYSNKSEFSNFFDFIKKRIEVMTNHNNIKIIDKIGLITEKDMEIIKIIINKIKHIFPKIKLNSDFELGLNLNKKNVEIEIKKLFSIQKSNNYIFIHSETYKKIKRIINNYNICQNNNIILPSNQITKEINNKNVYYNKNKKIEKKIRISFIGNIGVGKSMILNCIIGETILPTGQIKCTNRCIIIRYKNIDSFQLYRAKLKKEENYYYFENNVIPYCSGKENIKSYLNNKNHDKNISEEDAFIVIYGRLKIFDFLKFNEELLNKIEFIDFPGFGNKNNYYIENKCYQKIINSDSCCVYVNDSKSIDDKNNILNQYFNNNNELFPRLINTQIRANIFLINKSDILTKEDKIKITEHLNNQFFKYQKNLKKDNINIEFFSSKFLCEFLNIYNRFIIILEKNPTEIIESLYFDWFKSFYLKNFKSFVIENIIEKIAEHFCLKIRNSIETPLQFYNKMNMAFNQFFKNRITNIKSKDIDIIIDNLYQLNSQIKSKYLEYIKYSKNFFLLLMNSIVYCECLNIKNKK